MAMKTVYTHGNGMLLSENRSGVKRDYSLDPLGNTRALYDSTLTRTDTFDYFPSGTVAARTGTNPTPFQWNGGSGYFTDSSSRKYVRARNYFNSVGRWGEQDPIGFDGGDFNLYRYCGNRFVTATDPSGLGPPSCTQNWDQLDGDCKPSTDYHFDGCYPNFPRAYNYKATFTSPLHAKGGSKLEVGTFHIELDWLHSYRDNLLGGPLPPASSGPPSILPDPIPPSPIPLPIPPYPGYKPGCEKHNYFEHKSLTVKAISGTGILQYPGGWWVENGPIPPSNEVETPYQIMTRCHDKTVQSYVQGNEGFIFHVYPSYSENGDVKPYGVRPNAKYRQIYPNFAVRTEIGVHPDGSRTGSPNGTHGCIGIHSQQESKQVRSCLTVLGILSVHGIPLNVSY